jgi:hypothetical protein
VSSSQIHKQILTKLDDLIKPLTQGEFQSLDCLRVYCRTLPARYPDELLIPIYVSCTKISSNQVELASIVVDVTSAVLLDWAQSSRIQLTEEDHDYLDAAAGTCTVAIVDRVLFRHNVHVFLVVDEVESLWLATGPDNGKGIHRASSTSSFPQTRHLRTTRTICSPTASLPELLTNKSTLDRKRFPLLGTRNVNVSKYQDIRIPPCLPHDTKAVNHQLRVSLFGKQSSLYQNPREMLFFDGSNPRMIARLLESAQNEDKVDVARNVFLDHSVYSVWDLYGHSTSPCHAR